MKRLKFEWDPKKEVYNLEKHNVSFVAATRAFDDVHRVIRPDLTHSQTEERFFCFGMVAGEVITVRFTHRGDVIRIMGAAYWRKGRKYYEEKDYL